MDKLEGLIAAPFTPLDSNGNLNTSIIPEYYRFLEKNGIIGAFINGTTGEGPSLTQKEKQVNAEHWAKCAKAGGKVKIINLVGGTSYKECIENAVFSREIGISSIAIIGPYFFRSCDEEALAEYVSIIGEAVPEMEVYYYHFPAISGVNIKMTTFLKKISGMLPNFAGIKFTHEDLMDFIGCLNFKDGKYNILWGRDECMLSALATGSRGFVGSTYNYAAPLYHSIIEAFRKGNIETAQKLQLKAVEMIRLLDKYGGIATGKAFMKYTGIDCGFFRLPVKNMTPEMYEEFKKDVEKLGIKEFLSKP
ncbi:MAG: dihydrodipicolinate synthase family protein [Bacteroidales bacterium]